MIGFLLGAALPPDWIKFSIPEAHLKFQMPLQPKKMEDSWSLPGAIVYDSVSGAGELLVAYMPLNPKLGPAIKSVFKTDPASPVIQQALSMGVQRMAVRLQARIDSNQYGENLGLPADFATLTSSRGTMYFRVYLSTDHVYVFGGQGAGLQDFFDSIRLRPQIATGSSR